MTTLDTQLPDASRLRLQGDVAKTQSAGLLLVIFMITIMTPIAFEVGGLRLSPNRIFLLVAIIPFAVSIVQGKIGRFTQVDMLFLLHGMWIMVALTVIGGAARIPFAGITAVELIGGYFVGRVLIRDIAGYRRLFRIILIALLVLMPVLLIEVNSGKLVIPDLLRPIFDTPDRSRSAYGRLGFERVYGVFDHPILWGLFCSLTLANFVTMARGNMAKITFGVALSIFTTMLSLSSAPLMACALQIGLLAWGWIMGGRWKMLMIGLVVSYVVIDLLSDRTPVTILIETMTFNPLSGYTRIAIFDAGWAAVKGSPIFGIGFNDWPRPHWLTSSVDNFWLLTSMRYGLVGAGFLLLALLSHFWLLSKSKITDPDVAAARLGHSIALAGISFTMLTVHIWGTMSVFTMFYLGAGAWMYAYPQDQNGAPPSEAPADPNASRYSRFAPKSRDAAAQPSAPLSRPAPAPAQGPRYSNTTPRKDSTA